MFWYKNCNQYCSFPKLEKRAKGVWGASKHLGGINTLKDKTNRNAAAYSIENAEVRSVSQYVIDKGDRICLATPGMFWRSTASRP